MTFPESLTLVAVHGRVDLPPAGGAAGTAVFSCYQPLQGSVEHSIVPPFDLTAVCDAAGEFTISLPATNDPQWSPQDWSYGVVIRPGGGGAIYGTLQLDYAGNTAELADRLQVAGTVEPGKSYVLLSLLGVAGGVATLDPTTGLVPADQLPEGNGGDGGAVTSVNSRTGAVTLVATDVTDSTTVGRAVMKAADAAAARAAIGAGTSSLAIGTSSSTAAAGDAPAAAITAHVGAADPHTQYALESSLGGAALLNVGTGSGTVAAGNDSRFTDARTPTAHASSHASAGSDAITIAESQVTNLTTDLAAKAPLASPTFTGTPSLPTGTTGVTQNAADSSTKLATTAFVTTADNLKAPLASPTFTGTPAAPTATAATNTTQVATTAFATGGVSDHVAAANPHTQYKRTYVESAGTYAVSTTARDFVGTDDPAGKGFTLVAGDKWYAI